jgi:two-component system KDP operon response regulator KdpE
MSLGQILLVDDEPQLIRVLQPALEAAQYSVLTASDGEGALRVMAQEPCDAILLDLGLPDMDGKQVIERVREWSEVPIMVLSARDREAEKIAALDLGADDFVNKPFAIGELLARVRAMLRGRARRFRASAAFQAGDLQINLASRQVTVQGMDVKLTPREYDLLRTLATHAGRVLTHRQLVAAVWGPQSEVDAQFVRVLIAQLRQKIEADPSRPTLVKTEPGIGYRLVDA